MHSQNYLRIVNGGLQVVLVQRRLAKTLLLQDAVVAEVTGPLGREVEHKLLLRHHEDAQGVENVIRSNCIVRFVCFTKALQYIKD